MKKRLLLIVSLIGMILLTACGNKEQVNTPENEESKRAATSKGGFEDVGGNFITAKEFKAQQESYYDFIKKEQFSEALDVEETLKANAHLSGLSQEMVSEMHDNHNALMNLDEIKDKMKAAEEENRPEYEGEIIRQIETLKETKTKTKSVNELIAKCDIEREKIFSELAKKPGNKRYEKASSREGNEDFDSEGNVKDRGGVRVDQDPISEENVKTSDDVYGND